MLYEAKDLLTQNRFITYDVCDDDFVYYINYEDTKNVMLIQLLPSIIQHKTDDGMALLCSHHPELHIFETICASKIDGFNFNSLDTFELCLNSNVCKYFDECNVSLLLSVNCFTDTV